MKTAIVATKPAKIPQALEVNPGNDGISATIKDAIRELKKIPLPATNRNIIASCRTRPVSFFSKDQNLFQKKLLATAQDAEVNLAAG